ncbi:GNAT family N-acetyltransferase [Leifsonia poae]|uniref:GNAT family N-acetyltransferase n=1 Tax=Leifsonia poae TaxID=110933 RepID=UPI001CBD5B1A|nr:GNAT family N-acetyltransferase [Leifsonia poae]
MAETADDLKPVRERVASPQTYRPTHPLIAEWRAVTADDVDAVWRLQQAIDAADHPNYLSTRDEVAEHLGYSFVDLGKDSLLGLTADGRAVAVGLIVMPPLQETLVRSFLEGGVHPEFRERGIGRQLVEWSQRRALQQLAGSDKSLPAWMLAYADERAPQTARLLEHAGFRITRYFVALERALSEPVPSVEPAPGVRIVPFSESLSEATHAARTDSFRDHWGSQPMSGEQWRAWIGGTFRPDISFLAVVDGVDGEEVVGFVLCQVNEDDWAGQGFTGAYIGAVGTTRAWRGKRIAPALLARTLEACSALGWDRVTLDVDAENPSGAFGLYTRMGFTRSTLELCLVREF